MHKFAARWLNECPSLAESRKTWQVCGSTFRNKTNFFIAIQSIPHNNSYATGLFNFKYERTFPIATLSKPENKIDNFRVSLEIKAIKTCKCWCKPCLLLANYRLKKTEHSDPKVQNLKQSVILQENNSKRKTKRRSKKEIRYLILFPNLQSSWWLE